MRVRWLVHAAAVPCMLLARTASMLSRALLNEVAAWSLLLMAARVLL